MAEAKQKELKITVVDYETFSDIEFSPPSTFVVRDAIGNYNFVHTSSREEAQRWSDERYGKGKYRVISTKLQKTKSKREDGGYSCTGTATRQVRK